jgi:heme-degrading monooxygenase HmoA
MYLHRELYTVARGWASEFERRSVEMHAKTGEQPGSVRSYILRAAGNDSRYLSLRIWEARENAIAWRNDPWFAAYLQARPPAMYAWPPIIQYFEEIACVSGTGQPGFLVVVQGETLTGRLPAVEKWLENEAGAQSGAPGFVEHRSFGFLGGPADFLSFSAWTSQGAFVAAQERDAYAEFLKDKPLHSLLAVPPREEFYIPLHV